MREALAALPIDKPELVLLDLGLPDRDGLELITAIKAAKAALLIISARDATAEKVAALDLGADDYITKPFDTEEILARIRVALRNRLYTQTAEPVLRLGDLVIDLSPAWCIETVLRCISAPRNTAFWPFWPAIRAGHLAREHFAGRMGRRTGTIGQYLRVAARGLRRKLEDVPVEQSIIRNEPGIGYRLIVQIRVRVHSLPIFMDAPGGWRLSFGRYPDFHRRDEFARCGFADMDTVGRNLFTCFKMKRHPRLGHTLKLHFLYGQSGRRIHDGCNDAHG
jgi:two-component system KDP operon response regulator KdpE